MADLNLGKLSALVEALDPDLVSDLRERLGLVTSQQRVDAAISDAEVGVVEGMAGQLRVMSEVIRVVERQHRAGSERVDGIERELHRLRWQVEDLMANGLRERQRAEYEEQQLEPPPIEFYRRAMAKALDRARDTTSTAEDEVLVKALVGSLAASAPRDGTAGELLSIVTSGRIGPREIGLLRHVRRSTKQGLDAFPLSPPKQVDELFTLASVRPALVTVFVAPSPNGQDGGFIVRLDQVHRATRKVQVELTDHGSMLLRILDSTETSG